MSTVEFLVAIALIVAGAVCVAAGIGFHLFKWSRWVSIPTIVLGVLLFGLALFAMSNPNAISEQDQDWLKAHYRKQDILVLLNGDRADSMTLSTDTCILEVPVKHNPRLDRPDFTYWEDGTIHFLSDSKDPGRDACKQKEAKS